MTSRRTITAVPPLALWLGLAGSIGFAFMLKPRHDELINRHIADGNRERALELMGERGEGGQIKEERGPDLAESALADGNPALSARLYAEMLDAGKVPHRDQVDSMILAFRYTGRQKDAIRSIERYMDGTRQAERWEDLLEEKAKLHLELGDPSGAVDAYGRIFESREAPSTDRDLMGRLVQAALFSNRCNDLRPHYARLLEDSKFGRMSLGELAAIADEETGEERELFYRDAKQYAKYCEWNGEMDAAFDYYMKLAALGCGDSLKRCLELNVGLFRDNDLAMLLRELVPIEGLPACTLQLARILGEDARYGEAEKYYKGYLVDYPGSADVVFELGALHEEAGDYQRAYDSFARAFEMEPGNGKFVMRMAELLVTRREYEEALELYSGLADEDHTLDTVETYAMLAESIGRYDETNKARMLAFAHAKPPTVEHFIDLAESYRLIGDEEKELQVLRAAVEALPKNNRARIALAETFYRRGAFIDAVNILAEMDISSSMQAAALVVDLCSSTDDFELAGELLPEGIEDRFDFSPTLRIALGYIYEVSGKSRSALSLYSTVPDGEPAWQLVATSRFKAGDFERAELYQRRYLAGSPAEFPRDWVFLGDIYKTLGKDELARQAYKRSLDLLKTGINDAS